MNFLGSLQGSTHASALANLELDTRLFNWTYPTVQAIREGINEHFKETIFDKLLEDDDP